MQLMWLGELNRFLGWEVRGVTRDLAIPVVSVVPHLEAWILLAGAILPICFIQHFRLLMVLQVVVVLICSIQISYLIVHHHILSVHLRSRVFRVVN